MVAEAVGARQSITQQPQHTQPANHQVQAAATPEIIHTLGALEAALAGGGDAQAIQTAFAALSQAERQAHWQTGETVPFAEQLAAWEQNMERAACAIQNRSGAL